MRARRETSRNRNALTQQSFTLFRIALFCGAMCGWAVIAGGCAPQKKNLASGETCNRTVECADGLACVNNVCGTNLDDLTANGMSPVLPEAGTLPDGDVMDGDVPPPPDAGAPDTSTPPMDASEPMMDSSTPMMDAAMTGDAG